MKLTVDVKFGDKIRKYKIDNKIKIEDEIDSLCKFWGQN